MHLQKVIEKKMPSLVQVRHCPASSKWKCKHYKCLTNPSKNSTIVSIIFMEK